MADLTSVLLAPAIRAHLSRYAPMGESLDLELAGQAGSGRKYYRLRLQGALDDAYALQRRGAGFDALDDAVEVVRHVDRWYAGKLKELYADLDATAPIDEKVLRAREKAAARKKR